MVLDANELGGCLKGKRATEVRTQWSVGLVY